MALTKVQILLIRACKAREPIQRIRSIHRHYFVNLEDYSVPEYIMLQLLADAIKEANVPFSGYELTKFLLFQNPDLSVDNIIKESLKAHVSHIRFMSKYNLPASIYPKIKGE